MDNDEGNYDVSSNALFSQTILKGIKWYDIQYDMLSITKIPQGISAKKFTAANITPSTKWLCVIDDYDQIKDYQYAAWQEFDLLLGTNVEIESDNWLEGTLLLSKETTLQAEAESDITNLLKTQHDSIMMLWFIIKHMIVHNQEAWGALKEYVKTFDICDFPGENVPTACLKLKAVVAVLGNKIPSNAV